MAWKLDGQLQQDSFYALKENHQDSSLALVACRPRTFLDRAMALRPAELRFTELGTICL
jgi:hypothetical protein